MRGNLSFTLCLQLVYISVGASRMQKRRDVGDTPSVLPPPPRENLPTLLLLQPPHFEQLFQLMQSLSAMKTTVKGGVSTMALKINLKIILKLSLTL